MHLLRHGENMPSIREKSAVIIMTFWMISRKASGHIMGNICRSTVGENLIGLQVNKNRKSAVYQVRCLLYCGSFLYGILQNF